MKRKKRGINSSREVKIMTEMMRKIKAKGRMGANSSSWVSELLAVDCKKCGIIHNRRTQCSDGTLGCLK